MGDGVWTARRWVLGCAEHEGGCLGVDSQKLGVRGIRGVRVLGKCLAGLKGA